MNTKLICLLFLVVLATVCLSNAEIRVKRGGGGGGGGYGHGPGAGGGARGPVYFCGYVGGKEGSGGGYGGGGGGYGK